jgi:hypothetical protein
LFVFFPWLAGRFHNFELTQNGEKTRNGLRLLFIKNSRFSPLTIPISIPAPILIIFTFLFLDLALKKKPNKLNFGYVTVFSIKIHLKCNCEMKNKTEHRFSKNLGENLDPITPKKDHKAT